MQRDTAAWLTECDQILVQVTLETQQQISSMRSAWQTAEKERETLRQENVSLIEQVSSMRCAWETAEKERDTLKKENASLIENLSRAKSDFEYVLTIESEEKAGLLKRIETLQQQMKEEANIEAIHTGGESKEARYEELQAKNAGLFEDPAAPAAALDALSVAPQAAPTAVGAPAQPEAVPSAPAAGGDSAEHARLEQELVSIRANLDELETSSSARVAELEAQVKQLTEQLDTESFSHDDFRKTAEAHVAEFEIEVQQLKAKFETACAEHEQAQKTSAAQIEELNKDVQRLNGEFEAANARCVELEAKLAQATSAAPQEAAAAGQEGGQGDAVPAPGVPAAAVAAGAPADLAKEMEELTQQLAASKEQLRVQELVTKNLLDHVKALEKEVEELKRGAGSVEATTTLDKMGRERAELQETLQARDAHIEELKADMKTETLDMDKRYEELQAKNAGLSEELDKMGRERAELQETLQARESVDAEIEETLKEHNDSLKTLKERNASLEAEKAQKLQVEIQEGKSVHEPQQQQQQRAAERRSRFLASVRNGEERLKVEESLNAELGKSHTPSANLVNSNNNKGDATKRFEREQEPPPLWLSSRKSGDQLHPGMMTKSSEDDQGSDFESSGDGSHFESDAEEESADLDYFLCKFNCGYEGKFNEVHMHELRCSLKSDSPDSPEMDTSHVDDETGFECEFNCKYYGTYEEVCAHETNCPYNTSSQIKSKHPIKREIFL